YLSASHLPPPPFPTRRSSDLSLDHLVGAAEQGQRHADAESPGSLEIEEHLDFRGLLNRQLADLFALENAPGIDASQPIRLGNGAAIAHQAASGDGASSEIENDGDIRGVEPQVKPHFRAPPGPRAAKELRAIFGFPYQPPAVYPEQHSAESSLNS